MEKIKLDFMVVPEQLSAMAYVPNAMRIKIVDINAMCSLEILGASGKKLAEHGVEFYFEESIALRLIQEGIAIKI